MGQHKGWGSSCSKRWPPSEDNKLGDLAARRNLLLFVFYKPDDLDSWSRIGSYKIQGLGLWNLMKRIQRQEYWQQQSACQFRVLCQRTCVRRLSESSYASTWGAFSLSGAASRRTLLRTSFHGRHKGVERCDSTEPANKKPSKRHSNKVPASAELHACDPGGTESFRWNEWEGGALERNPTINPTGTRRGMAAWIRKPKEQPKGNWNRMELG